MQLCDFTVSHLRASWPLRGTNRGYRHFVTDAWRSHALPFAAAVLLGSLVWTGLSAPNWAGAQSERRLDQARNRTESPLRELAERPAKWMGRKITVEGLVSKVYGPWMFTIHGTGNLANVDIPVVGTDPITVLYERAGSPALRVNDRVIFTGNVLYFTRDAVLAVADARLPDDVYRRFTDHPMIVTNEVRRDNVEPADAPHYHSRGGVADVTYLITRPRLEDMVGHWARLSDVKVLALVSDRGFWVGEGTGRRLFAVLAPALDQGKMDQLVQVKRGQTLNLIGVIEKMPSREEAMRRWTTIDNKEADALAKEPAFLSVRSINIVSP